MKPHGSTMKQAIVGVERRKASWRDGGVAATRYERCNPGARKSSRDEDIHMHVDYWNDDQGVDVKGNNLPDEIWVELKNVNGDHGWLFGEATIIAFDMPELAGFVVVDREDLKDYCKDNVNLVGLVDKRDAYKRCYTRRGRKDIITMLVLSDLQQLKSYHVVKYNTTYIHPKTRKTCSVYEKSVS
mgnify:FL=1